MDRRAVTVFTNKLIAIEPEYIQKYDKKCSASILDESSFEVIKSLLLHLISSYAFLLGINSKLDEHRMEICVGHCMVVELSAETHQWGLLKQHALKFNKCLYWYCSQNYDERRFDAISAAKALFAQLEDLVAIEPKPIPPPARKKVSSRDCSAKLKHPYHPYARR